MSLLEGIKSCCCCKFIAGSRSDDSNMKEEDKVEAPLELKRQRSSRSSLGELYENEINVTQAAEASSSMCEDADAKMATTTPVSTELKLTRRCAESSSIISSSQHCLKLSSSSIQTIDAETVIRQTNAKVVPLSQPPPPLMRSPQLCDCEPCRQARSLVARNSLTDKASRKDGRVTFDSDGQW
mmetsp:Transcript_4487/g.5960  ORF Transcript_4487/g.5960 Transcript_4487/m.5960 type:complete len:183 (+) Transcript_4487:89-637(+)